MTITPLVNAHMSVQLLLKVTKIIPSCFQLTIFLLRSCVFLCVLFLLDLWTGAVGWPLPGVEVRIVMNNTPNTTIVEGSHRETQVIKEWISYKPIFQWLTEVCQEVL